MTVESTEAGRTFRGFQVTAHRVAGSGNPEEFIGTFNTSDNSSQTITCFGQAQVSKDRFRSVRTGLCGFIHSLDDFTDT